MRRRVQVLVAMLVAVVAAGCASESPSKGVQPSPIPSNSPTTSTSVVSGPSIGPPDTGGPGTDGAPASTVNVSTTISNSCAAERKGGLATAIGTSQATAMNLTNVEVRQLSACTDVVKFTFFSPKASAPSYNVSLQTGPFTMAASGATVAIPGKKFVLVRFEPAATYDFAAGTPTYVGSEAITPQPAASVQRVQLIDDSEGVVVWVIGMNELESFETLTTSSPPTLQLTLHR